MTDEERLKRMAEEVLRRSPADQAFSMKQLIDSMARQVPEDVGRGQVRGKRGEGAPRRKSGPKKKAAPGPRIRLYPTNSERLNRALVELPPTAFKVHRLLEQWRGAPHKGNLPYFTVLSVGRLCRMDPKTVGKAIRELRLKGWIRVAKYDKHHKNTLYKLVPIRDVPLPADRRPVQREFEAEPVKEVVS